MRSDFKQQSASRKHGHTVEHGTCRVTVDMRLGNARERFKKTKITVQSCGTMVRVGFRPRRWVFVACAGAPARVATRVVPRVGQIEREVWVICLHLVVVHLRWGGGRPQWKHKRVSERGKRAGKSPKARFEYRVSVSRSLPALSPRRR